ncbi:ferritin-like domain-containing protein [Falsiroseomonas sp. E2-1-a20]|uniref:ferritin-like domain-containing protein n=1 Tax=Falsiroseomonas sp. E2-1-a20 TaxID=3239300 RepID=UPI003F40E163
MSILKTEPAAAISTLEELFAMAEALEKDAASRYAALAVQMRAAALPGVADALDHIAAEERDHVARVTEWSRAQTGAAPDPGLISWLPPEAFDEEEARGIASSSLASAYRALSMAVRNEERAFALWTYIAAQADDPAIQEAAERMAREELRHAALLRHERRRAFHAEHQERDREDATAGRRTPEENAARVERDLALLLTDLANKLPGSGELRHLARESQMMADEAAKVAGGKVEEEASPSPLGGTAADTSLTVVLRLSEQTVEAYLNAAGAVGEEDAMRRLQALAEGAIARVITLRQMLSTH